MTRQREDDSDRLHVGAGGRWVTDDLRTQAAQYLRDNGHADLLPMLGLADEPTAGRRCPACSQPLGIGRTRCGRTGCIARAEP